MSANLIDIRQKRQDWLLSSRLDVLFFALPILAAVALLCLYKHSSVRDSTFLSFLLVQGLGLAPFHLGATWFHFLDTPIRNEFFGTAKTGLKSTLAAATVIVTAVCGYLLAPTIVVCAYVIWTVQHIVQQNVGILLLYQNPCTNEAKLDRESAISSLHSAGWLFSLIYLSNFTSSGTWQQAALVACIICTCYQTALESWRCLQALRKQTSVGKRVNRPMICFWVTALLFMLPITLVGKNFNEALLIPLVMHWFQYIGLNLVLAKHKGAIEKNPVQGLGSLLLVAAMTAIAVLALGGFAEIYLPLGTLQRNLVIGLFLGQTMLHYLQDALIWRFKNPVMRSRLLHFLKPPAPTAITIDARELLTPLAR